MIFYNFLRKIQPSYHPPIKREFYSRGDEDKLEEFTPEKIIVSCLKARAIPEVAREIAKSVDAKMKDEISAEEIRKIVLEQLWTKNPKWEQNWLTYDRAVKKRR